MARITIVTVLTVFIGGWLIIAAVYKIGYEMGRNQIRNLIAFTSGENKQNIINEITREQKELTDFANKRRAIYGK